MSDTHPIPFTQYLRPFGIPIPVTIDRPTKIALMASAIIESGYHFDCEHLTTGEASFTVGDRHDELIDIEVVANGPGVPEAIDRIVQRVFERINPKPKE